MLHFLKEKYFSSISKCCTFWKKTISSFGNRTRLNTGKYFCPKLSWRRRLKHLQEICFGRVIAEEWNREWPVAGCGHWVCMQEKLSKGGFYMSYMFLTTCTTAAVRLTCLQRAAAAAQTFLASAWCSVLLLREDSLWIPYLRAFLSRTGWKALEMQKLV